MPHYPITGMISHRHPFHGEGDFIDPVASLDETGSIYEALAADPEPSAWKWPLISAGAHGLASYVVARLYDVNREKASSVGFVVGGLSLLINYVCRKHETLLQQQQEPLQATAQVVR